MSNSPFRELHVKIEEMIERTKARIGKRRYHPSLTQENSTERKILSLFFPLSRYDPTFAHITEKYKNPASHLLRITKNNIHTPHNTQNNNITHIQLHSSPTTPSSSCHSSTPSRTKPSARSRTSYVTTATTGSTSARSPLPHRS